MKSKHNIIIIFYLDHYNRSYGST